MRHLSFGIVATTLLLGGCGARPAPVATASAPPHILSATLADTPLEVGRQAPDFEARAHDGSVVHLAALAGREVVVFFYTQDETPKSEREACDFRDAWQELTRQGVVVIGISRDSVASHASFAQHHRLPFPLLSDDNGELARAFGVPAPYGINDRQTIVVGRDGKVVKIYRTVDVTKHAAEILADVEG